VSRFDGEDFKNLGALIDRTPVSPTATGIISTSNLMHVRGGRCRKIQSYSIFRRPFPIVKITTGVFVHSSKRDLPSLKGNNNSGSAPRIYIRSQSAGPPAF
jgi:hypothetical protein